MLTKVLTISLAYVALGVLLLLLLIKPALHWRWKVLAILVSTFFFVNVFFETRNLLGWPGVGKLPERFQLLWVRVVEPDLRLHDPGAIYVWVEEVDENNVPNGVPRAYRLPYKRALAEKSAKARDQIMQGNPQEGTAEDLAAEERPQERPGAAGPLDKPRVAEGAPLEAVSGVQRLDLDALEQSQQIIEFRAMPPTLLPVKRPP